MDERRDLGAGGLAYIRQRREGGKTLAKLLLEGLDLSFGSAWAYPPPDMPEEQARKFDEWNYRPAITGSTAAREWTLTPVEEMAWRFLAERENAIGVWEDELLDASGLWVQNHPDEPLAFVGEEVYSIVSGLNLTQETFNDAMGSMVAWWGAPAILATPPTEALTPLLEPRPSLTPAQLEPLVSSLHVLFFSAYDDLASNIYTPSHPVGSHQWKASR